MKNITQLKTVLLAVLLTGLLNAQVLVNREWKATSGSPVFNPILNAFGVQWSNSIKVGSGLVTVGHTNVSGQGENIFLTKYDNAGVVVFQVNYNTGATHNDYGTAVVEASNGDLFVCGTTDNGGTSDYDVVILKYKDDGTLLASTIYAGAGGLNDVGTAIAIHPVSSKVVIAGTTENPGKMYDYLALIVDPVNLAVAANNSYDYSSLNDIAVGITFNVSDDICLIGASAITSVKGDYCVAAFDAGSLTYLSEVRSSIAGIGYDQPLAFCKDAAQNIYLTGRASANGINYDIKTIKINANFTIAWSAVYDGAGLEDAGNTIGVDQNGDVIIGGFATKTSNLKELVCRKYNGATGALMWHYNQPAQDLSGDAFMKALNVDAASGNIYYTGGTKGYTSNAEALVGKLTGTGYKIWERTLAEAGGVLPTDLKRDTSGIYIIAYAGATSTYEMARYTELTKSNAVVNNASGEPGYKATELIVRFCAKAMNRAAIDNLTGTRLSEYGRLSDFLTDTAYSQVAAVLNEMGVAKPNMNAVKIFKHQLTTEATAVTRLGDTIPVPDFWTALTLMLPPDLSIKQANAAFKTLPKIVAYSHPNYIGRTTSVPDDPFYGSNQYSLHAIGTFTNAHINVEEAWNVYPRAGSVYVRCGVFDTGIDDMHKDFELGPYVSKIEGWDFYHNSYLGVGNHPYWLEHGTACAGIIGANRNNGKGVAGIAGGDNTLLFDQFGIKLYSLNILGRDTIHNIIHTVALGEYAPAIIESTKEYNGPGAPYRYALNLSSNSWVLEPSDTITIDDSDSHLLKEAVHFANRMKVTIVASRDNQGRDNIVLPAVIDDDWILNVGGTGNDGNYLGNTNNNFACSYGHDVDVAAPAYFPLTLTTYPGNTYANFSGTSAAAPHVAGVVGLLMSYMNPTVNPTQNYNNLAPEDCEAIIQMSATDVGPTGYDEYTGYGRLNAGKAMRLVEKPYHALYHFGNTTPSLVQWVYSNSDTVMLAEAYQNLDSVWFQRGKYIVRTYGVNGTLNHNLYNTDSIMRAWPRHSSSGLFGLFDPITKLLYPRQRISLNTCNQASAALTGFIYQVKDTLGNNLGWWPCNNTLSAPGLGHLFEYSVLVKNTAVGIEQKKEEKNGARLFPNPASKAQTLVIETGSNEQLTVELYDMMGKLLKTIYKGDSTGQTTLQTDISSLPNSMYLYVIKTGNDIKTIKFIKQ